MASPTNFLEYVDANEEKFIQRLADAVAIPRYVQHANSSERIELTPEPLSISGDASHRKDVFTMATFMEDTLKSYGVETRRVDLGTHTMDGQTLPLPPAILGRIGNDKSKKTVLIYGHFDVQPVSIATLLSIQTGSADCILVRPTRVTAGTPSPSRL